MRVKCLEIMFISVLTFFSSRETSFLNSQLPIVLNKKLEVSNIETSNSLARYSSKDKNLEGQREVAKGDEGCPF